jgi:protein-S-isoprenylcysteine O-methyltransferase Ste14
MKRDRRGRVELQNRSDRDSIARAISSASGVSMESWKHLRAIVLLPGMVTVVIPGAIVLRIGLDTQGVWRSFPASRVILPVFSLLLIGLGLTLIVSTVRLVASVGKGTLAPWNPTQRLVVEGVYRHVRNPMISGVFAILLGESLLAASLPLLRWFLLFVFVNAVYIPLAEEPGLVRRFGEDYLTYKQHVPRWIPRLKPWAGL